MVGIAEEPPRQLAPSVEIATLDFVIRAGFFIYISGQNTSGKFIYTEADHQRRHCSS
jgi:hypothetical protein